MPSPTTNKPVANKPTISWGDRITNWAAKPSEWFGGWWQQFDNLPQRNFDQAATYLEEGRYYDAIFRLKVAIWLSKDFPQALYLLGSCYYTIGNMKKSLEALRKALSLAPKDENIIYMLATIDESQLPAEMRPDAMPLKLVRSYFDKLADGFDDMQREEDYRGHIFVDQAVRANLDTTRTNYKMLDLGCGTGAVGLILSDFIGYITGVDCAKDMIKQASNRRSGEGNAIVYNKTYLQEVRTFMKDIDKPEYDVITAAHVLNFIGGLDDIFDGAAKGLHEGGIFVFQVEIKLSNGYGMPPGDGHFAHSDSYIKDQAVRTKLKVLGRETVMVYPHRRMNQYVMQKPSN